MFLVGPRVVLGWGCAMLVCLTRSCGVPGECATNRRDLIGLWLSGDGWFLVGDALVLSCLFFRCGGSSGT
jgi:hypothetical protein